MDKLRSLWCMTFVDTIAQYFPERLENNAIRELIAPVHVLAFWHDESHPIDKAHTKSEQKEMKKYAVDNVEKAIVKLFEYNKMLSDNDAFVETPMAPKSSIH